jgi:hypothetical protein
MLAGSVVGLLIPVFPQALDAGLGAAHLSTHPWQCPCLPASSPAWRRCMMSFPCCGVACSPPRWWPCGMHLAFFMSFYCGLRAVGGAAPVLDVLTAMPIVDMAASLPVSISGLGVRERTFEALLSGIAGVCRRRWAFPPRWRDGCSICSGVWSAACCFCVQNIPPPDARRRPRTHENRRASPSHWARPSWAMPRMRDSWRACMRSGVRPVAVAGSSAGAITAGLYAAGLGAGDRSARPCSARACISPLPVARSGSGISLSTVFRHLHPGFLNPNRCHRPF